MKKKTHKFLIKKKENESSFTFRKKFNENFGKLYNKSTSEISFYELKHIIRNNKNLKNLNIILSTLENNSFIKITKGICYEIEIIGDLGEVYSDYLFSDDFKEKNKCFKKDTNYDKNSKIKINENFQNKTCLNKKKHLLLLKRKIGKKLLNFLFNYMNYDNDKIVQEISNSFFMIFNFFKYFDSKEKFEIFFEPLFKIAKNYSLVINQKNAIEILKNFYIYLKKKEENTNFLENLKSFFFELINTSNKYFNPFFEIISIFLKERRYDVEKNLILIKNKFTFFLNQKNTLNAHKEILIILCDLGDLYKKLKNEDNFKNFEINEIVKICKKFINSGILKLVDLSRICIKKWQNKEQFSILKIDKKEKKIFSRKLMLEDKIKKIFYEKSPDKIFTNKSNGRRLSKQVNKKIKKPITSKNKKIYNSNLEKIIKMNLSVRKSTKNINRSNSIRKNFHHKNIKKLNYSKNNKINKKKSIEKNNEKAKSNFSRKIIKNFKRSYSNEIINKLNSKSKNNKNITNLKSNKNINRLKSAKSKVHKEITSNKKNNKNQKSNSIKNKNFKEKKLNNRKYNQSKIYNRNNKPNNNRIKDNHLNNKKNYEKKNFIRNNNESISNDKKNYSLNSKKQNSTINEDLNNLEIKKENNSDKNNNEAILWRKNNEIDLNRNKNFNISCKNNEIIDLKKNEKKNKI